MNAIDNELGAVSGLDHIREIVIAKPHDASKYVTYRTQLNPSLSTHPVYSCESYIPDFMRQAFTRIRLMSHSLKVETGRWSRIPVELRVCPCENNVTQTEEHVLLHCPFSEHCRQNYPMLDFSCMIRLIERDYFLKELCNYMYDVLKLYV